MDAQSQVGQEQFATAPIWHTCCVLALLTASSGLLAFVHLGSASAKLGHLSLFVIVTLMEWVVFAFSLWNSSVVFVEFVKRAARAPRSLLLDIPVALLLSAITFVVALILARVLGQSGWASVQGMRPNNGFEIAAWIVMAISAGICEETVFRGYLQRQISFFSGRVSIGIFGQAAVFGLCHAYQGWKNMVLIFVLGCIYGVSVVVRRGLRANMIAHAGVDILAAF